MNEPARKSPLGIIFLTVFLDILGFAIILPLLPDMLEHYLKRDGGDGALGQLLELLARTSGSAETANVEALFGAMLMGIYSILQFLFAPFWGTLSDRIGRRPVLLFTIGGITFSYFLWFFSGSFALLIAARLLGGIMSGNISTATAAVADSTTPEDRPKGMGMVGAAIGLGFTLGPAIDWLFNEIHLSEQFPSLQAFGVNPFSGAAAGALVLSLINLVGVWRRFDETLSPEDRGKAREARRTISPAKLFRRVEFPGVGLANLTYFLYYLAFSGMESTLTFLAKYRLEFGQRQIAYLFLYLGLIMVVVQGGLIRQLAPIYGEKKLTITGLALLIPGLLVVGIAPKVGVMYLGLALVGFGSAFITPSLSSLVSLYTPAEHQGGVLGIFRSLGALARAVGPFLAGLLYWRFSATAPYVAAALLCVIPLVLAFWLPTPRARLHAEK